MELSLLTQPTIGEDGIFLLRNAVKGGNGVGAVATTHGAGVVGAAPALGQRGFGCRRADRAMRGVLGTPNGGERP